jgi:hypothetical protein
MSLTPKSSKLIWSPVQARVLRNEVRKATADLRKAVAAADDLLSRSQPSPMRSKSFLNGGKAVQERYARMLAAYKALHPQSRLCR